MSKFNSSILIVEDDEAAVFGYESYLRDAGFEVETALTLKDARLKTGSEPFDLILLDLKLPDGNSIDWIPKQKQTCPDTPVIVITGGGDIPTAVRATKNGAENFLTKPVDMEELKRVVEKSLELKRLRKKSILQKRLAENREPFFGTSDSISELLKYAQLASANDSIVLLQGETGTGKGVLARWIHENSARSNEPFVELNCSSLNGELLRSELYGHVKGAFTSAVKDREGLIEMADGGTLFLDEIGDMDIEVQARLLKTIEERTFRRIGENRLRKSNFRLICASNRDLLAMTREKKFRNDLYYRICVFPVTVPSLRERKDDISGLARYFLTQFGYSSFPLAVEINDMLINYSWPGNVRELRNMLERAVLLARGGPLKPVHFPGLDGFSVPAGSADEIENLSEMTNRHILSVLKKYRGNKKNASRALGMSFSNLYRKLSQINGTD